jgi:hypothetical protein
MSTATYSQPQSYFVDVSNAARAFAAALFAARERQFVAQEVTAKPAVSPRAKEKSRLKLFSLAREYEEVAPSLSAELRFLASRG